MDQKKLEKLVLDLVRLGDYSSWVEPKQPENVEWFSKHGNIKTIYKDGKIASKRLEELALLGADLIDKAYIISNVNCPELLEVALKYGADPNIAGKSMILPYDRAVYKGRTQIASLLIHHPQYDFNQFREQNALFTALQLGRYKLANEISDIKPELMLSIDKNGNNALMCISQHLAKNKINSKAITFIKKCIEYCEENGQGVTINAINKQGQSIASLSQEVATLVTEYQSFSLASKLSKKNNFTQPTQKIKL